MKPTAIAAALFAAALAPAPAYAQLQVFDPSSLSQLVIQVSKSAQQIALLESQLQAALQTIQKLDTSITPGIQNIVSDIDSIFQASAGIGFSPLQSVSAFQSLYPETVTAGSLGSLQATLTSWRQKTWRAQQDLVAAQSAIAGSLHQNASAVTTAVATSQGAPGPTAALQSTNQLLSALSVQLAQIEGLMVTSTRAAGAAAAEQQSVGSTAAAVSAQALQAPAAVSRLTAPGHL